MGWNTICDTSHMLPQSNNLYFFPRHIHRIRLRLCECLSRTLFIPNFLLYFFTLCYSVFSLIPPQLFGLELFLFRRHRFLILLAFRVLIRLMFLLRCFFLLLLSSMFIVWCRFHGMCDKNRVFVGDKPWRRRQWQQR